MKLTDEEAKLVWHGLLTLRIKRENIVHDKSADKKWRDKSVADMKTIDNLLNRIEKHRSSL